MDDIPFVIAGEGVIGDGEPEDEPAEEEPEDDAVVFDLARGLAVVVLVLEGEVSGGDGGDSGVICSHDIMVIF